MTSISEIQQDFQEAVKRGSKIDAIKIYREWKNVSLKEATDYVLVNWESLRALA